MGLGAKGQLRHSSGTEGGGGGFRPEQPQSLPSAGDCRKLGGIRWHKVGAHRVWHVHQNPDIPTYYVVTVWGNPVGTWPPG